MTTEDKKPNARRIKTVPFRMSFPALLAPRETNEDGVKKSRYELSMLFPPDFDRKPLMAALRAAMVEEHGNDPKQWPKLKRKPDDVIMDFAEYNSERDKPLPGDWAGWTLVRANASVKHPPGVVASYKRANPNKGGKLEFPVITDEREVFAGRWARATIEAFYYNHKTGGKGVTFGLVNVQLLKHDTKFGGAITAPEQDFDDDVSAEWAGGEADDFDKGASTTEAAEEDTGW